MTTTIVYPDAGTGGTTVDGHVRRHGVDQTFSAIRTGAGTGHGDTYANENCAQLSASTTSGQYSVQRRSIITANTSGVPSGDTVSSLTLSLYGSAKGNGLGEPALDVVTANPASDNDLVNADYSYTLFGATALGSVAYADFSTAGYNDIAVDPSVVAKGVGAVTKLGLRLAWDTQNSFGGSWVSAAFTSFQIYFADQAGTTNDPKLTIVHAVSARRAMVIS